MYGTAVQLVYFITNMALAYESYGAAELLSLCLGSTGEIREGTAASGAISYTTIPLNISSYF
jgi:hypothetical protein